MKDINHFEGQEKYEMLRKQFPFFVFEEFNISETNDLIEVTFHFNIADIYFFKPKFSIQRKKSFHPVLQSIKEDEKYSQLIFNIGMIELISYWKLSCAPQVIIKPYSLTSDQLKFWLKTYYNGLGEFFHTNSILTGPDDFMQISSFGAQTGISQFDVDDKVLVPVGGGKDSIVTLELLRKSFDIRPFILNPRGATLDTVFAAKFGRNDIAEIQRTLDPLLLQLNSEGFLNGHTPFSAMLAFYTLLVAALYGIKHIALSNESSANEPTIPGTTINHQYSKSFEFEKDFREYVHRFISADFNYFSFLRPLDELRIASIFAKQVKYYSVFKSCNVGSKTDTWCCNCPKCLFAYIILSPFIPQNELVHIFGENLYEKSALIGYFKELTGLADNKPFECVGTLDDVNIAVNMYIALNQKRKLPLLADYYTNSELYENRNHYLNPEKLLHFGHRHFLTPEFEQVLKDNL